MRRSARHVLFLTGPDYPARKMPETAFRRDRKEGVQAAQSMFRICQNGRAAIRSGSMSASTNYPDCIHERKAAMERQVGFAKYEKIEERSFQS